ncbi:hypothetical protein ACFSTE_05870 [Aquimarina hainanensis]|uniref:Uncharacterized protein n=1 Tax=Aquimarina hainanensis TaxID=1578017 RepID=A0ABW5N596_9FLAO
MKIQLLEKEITKEKQRILLVDELDISYEKLVGIAILSNLGQGHIISNSTLAGVEVFPKNFEVDFLQSNYSVAPQKRFFPLQYTAKGKKIELEITDSGKMPVYPYTFRIYLLLSNE